MYVCTCMYMAQTCMYMYVYGTDMYVCTQHVAWQVCVRTCMSVHMYVCVHLCMYVCMYGCIYVRMHRRYVYILYVDYMRTCSLLILCKHEIIKLILIIHIIV